MSMFNRAKVHLKWLWEGHKPSIEEVEKAVIRKQNEKGYESI